jgi:NTE family protein
MTNTKQHNLTLVIGWGSVKCAAALGLMRVLDREGIQIDMVVGAGGGSIYAALIALGYSAEEIVEINARLWTHEVTRQRNRKALWQLLLPHIFLKSDYFNLTDDTLVNERLRAAMGENRFEDTHISLHISATNYTTGQQVTISQGMIVDAVRASIALPLIFAPWETNGELLAAGYLSEPLPIGVAIREGANIILAMGFESVSHLKPKGFADYVQHLSNVMSNNMLHAGNAFYNLAHHAEVIAIVPQFEMDIAMFDTHLVPEIIAAGEQEGEKILPELKRLLARQT